DRGSNELIQVLLRALKDPDAGIQLEALKGLAQIGQPAVAGLLETLGDDDLDLRNRILLALGKIGPAAHEAVPLLLELLTDEHLDLRESALQALERIDPQWASQARPK